MSRLCFAFFEADEFCTSTYKSFCNSIFEQIGIGQTCIRFFLGYGKYKELVKEKFLDIISSHILISGISEPRRSVAFCWAWFYKVNFVLEYTKIGNFASAHDFLEVMKTDFFFNSKLIESNFELVIKIFIGITDDSSSVRIFSDAVSIFFNCTALFTESQDNVFFGSEVDRLLNNIFVFERILFGFQSIGDDEFLKIEHFQKAFCCISRLSEIFLFDSQFFFKRWCISRNSPECVDNWLDFAILISKASLDVTKESQMKFHCIRRSLFPDNFLCKMLWRKIFLHEETLSDLENLSLENLLCASFVMTERLFDEKSLSVRSVICEFLTSIDIEIDLESLEQSKISMNELYEKVLFSLLFSEITNFDHELNIICSMFKGCLEALPNFLSFTNAIFTFSNACRCKITAIECFFFNMGFKKSAIKELFSDFESNGVIEVSNVSKKFEHFFAIIVARKIISLCEKGSNDECFFNENVVNWAVLACAYYEFARFGAEIRESCLSVRKNDWNGDWWSRLVFFVDQLYEDAVWPSCSSINYTVLLNVFRIIISSEENEYWNMTKNFESKARAIESLFDILSKQQLFNSLIAEGYECNTDSQHFSSFAPLNLLSIFVFGTPTTFFDSSFSSFQISQTEFCFPYGSLPNFDFSKVGNFDAPKRHTDCTRESLQVLHGLRCEYIFSAFLKSIGFSHDEIEALRSAQFGSFRGFVEMFATYSENRQLFKENVRSILRKISEEISRQIDGELRQEVLPDEASNDGCERVQEVIAVQEFLEDVVGFDQRSRTNLELGI